MSMMEKRVQTVLVVDDQPHIARVVKLSLEDLGCTVKTAGSGAAALSACASGSIDLMIIDVGMPDIDGLETVRLIRALPRYADLRIIILTGSGDTNIRHEAERLGVAQFLTKPFSPTDLERRVKSLLNL